MENHGCRAEINVQRLAANYLNAKENYNQNIIAVVKADAYGHGAARTVKELLRCGATRFAVASVTEAAEVRACAPDAEITVLGFVDDAEIRDVIDKNLTVLIYDERSLALAKRFGLNAFVKVDTGMGRLGFTNLREGANAVKKYRGVKGVFTHLSCADSVRGEDIEYTEKQLKKLLEVKDILKNEGRHGFEFIAAASAAAIKYGGAFDGVRLGAALYGIPPSTEVFDCNMLPIMTLKSTISQVKSAATGDYASYGRTYGVAKSVEYAVVQAGYADGYKRALSGKAYARIRGKTAKAIGNITMDQNLFDVSGIGAAVGDEVVLFGDNPTALQLAEIADTISYEIVCGISKRVPRIYV